MFSSCIRFLEKPIDTKNGKMCNGNLESSSILPTNSDLGGIVVVDFDVQMDSQLVKLPKALQMEIQQHQLPERSQLTHAHGKIPCSLLKEIKEFRKNKIVDILRDILQVAAANGDESKEEANDFHRFVTPMRKSTALKVDPSKLSTLSLDDSDEESKTEECQEPNIATSSSSPKESITKGKYKKVWFNPRTSIQLTISREDMTDEEKKNYWLQDREFALFRTRDGYLGDLVEEKQREMGMDIETDSYVIAPSSIAISPQHWICTRGLEYKMKMGFSRTKERREACLEEVIVEQERQWDEHWEQYRGKTPFCYDFESIAAVSIGISDECIIHAQNVATNDQQDVEEMLRAEEIHEECKE